MTTYELLNVLNELLEILRQDSELEKLLSEISKDFDKAVSHVGEVANSQDPNQSWNATQSLKTSITAV